MSEFYTSNSTSLYLQKGPGREVQYLGECHSLDSLPDNRPGREAVICVDSNGDLSILGKKQTAPDLSTFDIESLLLKSASWLERLTCPYTLFLVQKCNGKKGVFKGWERAEAATEVENVSGNLNNAMQRDADDEITVTRSFTADPRRLDWFDITAGQKTTAETEDANTNDVYPLTRCGGRCGEMLEPGEVQVVGFDAVAAATANVQVSQDFGNTWTTCATDPFAADENVTSIRFVQIDNDTVRIIAARDGDVAAALEIGYSDDLGATWTNITVGATNNEAVTRHHGMHVIDESHIWLCTDAGRVYKSADAGITWTEQTTALVASGAAALYAIHFYDENLGVAAGAGDVIIITTDGGENWSAATATGGAGDIYAISFIEPYTMICGDDDGNVWLSFDRSGSAWEVLTATEFADAASGDVTSIYVHEDQQTIWLVNTNATPDGYVYRSITGGRIFERVSGAIAANGLNAVVGIDPNWAMACGEDDGSIGVIMGAGKYGA